MSRGELTDEQWERFRPLLPPQKPKTGRPALDHRIIVNGILWIDRTGAPWRDLPQRYGPWQTVASRFYRWSKAGIWQRLLQNIQQQADARGKLGWDEHYIDSTIIRAHQHSAGAKGGDPVAEALGRSQGGFSTKVHLRAEQGGKPITLLVSPGQQHEAVMFEPLMEQGSVMRQGRGRPKLRPKRVVGDKGYSSGHIRRYLKQRGIRATIPYKSNERHRGRYDGQVYRERNLVERTINRLKQLRRVATRYEKRGEKLPSDAHYRCDPSMALATGNIDLIELKRSTGKVEETYTPRRPVLLAVDDDTDALAKIEHELCSRYGSGYRVVCEASAEAGVSIIERCKANGEDVALVLADQWMPEITGAEFLTRVRQVFPTTKRALLIAWGAWGDEKTREAILQSMTFGQIDYYLIKPWWPSPDEMFHRTVTELLYEWAKAHRSDVGEIRVVGDRRSQRSHELRDLLGRNRILNRFYEADSEEGRELLARAGQTSARLPVVMLLDGQVLVDPSYAEIIDAFGVRTRPKRRDFDLIVIGAGPAGLAATVYGASEGLSTLMVEREAVGGQAGTSSLIRNYPGFPWGISGSELTAQVYLQTWVFGATSNFALEATGLRRDGDTLVVTLSEDTEVSGNAVIIATGVSYRRLEVPDLEALQGTGVFYGAAISEASAMEGQNVYIVGGANSAGQAAMHLSEYAAHVTLLVRGGSLAASMSDYLVREIEATENIEVRFRTRVVGGSGAGRLEHLILEDLVSGLTETVPASALFVLIGARPHTEWLPEEIQRDKGGYILTGQDLLQDGQSPREWTLEQPPLLLESSMPGVFAAGDVRHRSVKRVATAVGEGSIAVQMVHDYLTKLKLGVR